MVNTVVRYGMVIRDVSLVGLVAEVSQNDFRRDFFFIGRSENLRFPNNRILPDITAKLFVFGFVRNLRKDYYFETLVRFVKLHKN